MFDALATYRCGDFNLNAEGNVQPVLGCHVSANFFDVLGVSPALGRTFSFAEEQPDQVAVVSYGFWQRRFGGDAAFVGKIIQMNGKKYTVVGIMPAGFHFPSAADLWAPAAIDPASRRKVADIPLKGHPESFQFNETGSRIFVNVPDARQVAIVDAESGQQISTLDTAGAGSNFPMAVDVDEHRLLVAFRSPAKLMVFATRTGKLEGSFDICRDADDVFVDPQRRRLYVSCGEGVIDVLAQTSDGYERVARIPTVAGARTSLFAVATDRLYLGVRATAAEPAAIWVFRPQL